MIRTDVPIPYQVFAPDFLPMWSILNHLAVELLNLSHTHTSQNRTGVMWQLAVEAKKRRVRQKEQLGEDTKYTRFPHQDFPCKTEPGWAGTSTVATGQLGVQAAVRRG